MEIIMHKYKEMNLEGATLINGFPSSGLMNTIVASYLVSVLKLDQICGLDSDDFPPVSMIYDSKPKFPARIYADEQAKIVIFLSEFTPVPQMARDIARTMLDFAKNSGCIRILSPETQIIENDGFQLFAVGSTDTSIEEIKTMEIDLLMHSIVSGISGVLLNEGKLRRTNVIVPIAQRGTDISDARTAAHIIEFIDKLIPTIQIDLEPLYKEAEGVEDYLRKLREHAKKPGEHHEEQFGMYR